ncbi:T6SS immunity protein Tdi1 domain-containing protein [Mesorhizobium sophorae]|uniref:T6SS immunity protein Tdi1 domain-containing protein n=1 Tax=Mesorhizobium sophorae TaxID=1300294 RepID=UPI000BA4E444|nr:T6SS immunity protein Tdi1 domain-containing protein [Mesorhizobium sophorae]
MGNPFSRLISSIFGGFRTVGDEPDGRSISAVWPPDLKFLFIEPSGKDVAEALDGWKWIGLDGLEPTAVSAFGDIFFRASDGSIHLLDTITGRLRPVSANWDEFSALVQNADSQDDLLLAGLVKAARKNGLILKAGQCYDFKTPPVLGGEMSVEQTQATFFVVKVHIAGQIHGKIKDLPPGTKINKVTISNG